MLKNHGVVKSDFKCYETIFGEGMGERERGGQKKCHILFERPLVKRRMNPYLTPIASATRLATDWAAIRLGCVTIMLTSRRFS